jgi:hypothetical protein
MFYLVYSAGHCCGRHCNYVTGVARSRSLLGPWEKRPEPFLEDSAAFRCPGHVGLASARGGGLLLAYHAYARGDPANRQFLIAPLRFDAQGWPSVGPSTNRAASAPRARLDFGDTRLGLGWQWPVGPRPAARSVRGTLRLGRGVFARQAGTATFTARTVVTGARHGARPGLAVMASAGDAIGVELRGGRALAWRADDGHTTALGDATLGNGRPVELRLTVGSSIRIAVRAGRGWQRLARPQAPPRWTSGPRVALRVNGPAAARASFDRLWIDPR